MATSPHQPESLEDMITRRKTDLTRKEALLAQIETIGISNSGGGTSVTYSSRENLVAEIHQLRAIIESLVAQLNGTAALPPGVGLFAYRSEVPPYAYPPAAGS